MKKNLSTKLRLTQNAVLMDTVKIRLTDAATSTVPEILSRQFLNCLKEKRAEEINALLAGNTCGCRPTSCADQLAKAVME